ILHQPRPGRIKQKERRNSLQTLCWREAINRKTPLDRESPIQVRIHLPPAVSRQTIGSSAAEPHLPFVMSQPSSKTSILIAFGLVLRERSGPLTRRDRGFESGFLQPAPRRSLNSPVSDGSTFTDDGVKAKKNSPL